MIFTGRPSPPPDWAAWQRSKRRNFLPPMIIHRHPWSAAARWIKYGAWRMSGVRRNPERHAFLGKEFRENRDKACTKMIEQATNRDLAQGLRTHLEETKKQIERLDQVFKKLNEQPKGTECPAIQ